MIIYRDYDRSENVMAICHPNSPLGQLESEYIECLGCSGEFIPNYDKVDHSISWFFETKYIIRSKDSHRFCGYKCREDFRERQHIIGSGNRKVTKPVAAKVIRSSYISNNSPIGMLERMFDSDICLVCLSLGGFNNKPRNKAICSYHLSKPPKGFKCRNEDTNCKYKQEKEGNCPNCSIKLTPYWSRLPEGLEFLYGTPKLQKWLYAQISLGRGKERGLETLDRIGEILGIGNGSKILDNLIVVETLEKVRRIKCLEQNM